MSASLSVLPRITVHLGATERAMLAGIQRRRDEAARQYQIADHEFQVTAIALVAARGMKVAEIIDLTDAGLVATIVVAGPDGEESHGA